MIPRDPEFLTNLILQRTRPFIALLGQKAKGALWVWTETGRRDHLLPMLETAGLVETYLGLAVAEIEKDADEYISRLRGFRPRRIVSVGCGSGVADAVLCRRLKPDGILLVDREEGGHTHGMNAEGAGYASLQTAARLLRIAAPGVMVEVWNPDRQPEEPCFPFDLMVSMYAMGFHFPANVYDGFISRNAQAGALIMYDARGNDGRVIVSKRVMP